MTTVPAPADRLKELRAKHRSPRPPAVPPGHVQVDGQTVPWQAVTDHLVQAYAASDALERAAVLAARDVGVSWDRIAASLGERRSGESLRRRYAL